MGIANRFICYLSFVWSVARADTRLHTVFFGVIRFFAKRVRHLRLEGA